MKYVLLHILAFITLNSFTQEWIRYYGFGQQPFAYDCLEYYDNGFILSGDVNDFKYGWIIKTDINGNQYLT